MQSGSGIQWRLGGRRRWVASRRRGSLLLEAVVASIILGAAMAILVPTLTAMRHQRLNHRFETLALVELQNLAGSLAAAAEPAPKISDWFQQRYALAKLQIEPLPDIGDSGTENLSAFRLTLLRPGGASVPDQKVSFVVWRPASGTQGETE